MKKLKCVRWLLAAFLIQGVVGHGVFAVEINGNITENTVWTSDLNPYVITSNVEIDSGVTLTISDGVVVKFGDASTSTDGFYMKVNGTLRALGVAGNPIVITSSDITRNWKYIEFAEESVDWDASGNTGCLMTYCVVEYGGNGSDTTNGNAAIKILASSPRIQNTVVRYSKEDGIIASGGTQSIENNRIHDTLTAIRVTSSDGGSISGNYLVGNTRGILLDSATQTLTIENNTVDHTSSDGNGACLGINLQYHNRLTTYLWEQTAGTTVTLSDAGVVQPTFDLPNEVAGGETLTFNLTVTDDVGYVSVDTVNVAISRDNQAPTAEAGDNQTLDEGAAVALNGTASLDTDGSIASYAWTQAGGATVTLTGTADARATFTAPSVAADEVLTFQLTVTDNDGAIATDTVTVAVEDTDTPALPVAVADAQAPLSTSIQAVTEGTTVNLVGSQSTSGLTVVSWFWEQTEGSDVTLNNTTSQNADFTVADVIDVGETFTFQLTVRDSLGREVTDTVIVNVEDDVADTPATDPNQTPVANGGADQSVPEGTSNILLDGHTGTTDDATTSIATYGWVQISGPSVFLTTTGTTGERKFNAPDVDKDEALVFQLTVTDTGDLRSTDEVTVAVTWVNDKPTASAGSDQSVSEGENVLLDGSVSSDDVGIATWLWSQVSGTSVTLNNASGSRAFFTAPTVTADETLVFLLTVTDAAGKTDQDMIHVDLADINASPVADAGSDQQVAYGAAVTLAGADSSDADGTVDVYSWAQISGQVVPLTDADTAAPAFTAPAAPAGSSPPDFLTLVFELTVTDNDGSTDIDTVTVNAHTAGLTNQAPTALAGPDQSGLAVGETVTLDGSASFDPDLQPTLVVQGNKLMLNDSEGLGNIVVITAAKAANCSLIFTGNSLLKTAGNFALFIHDWAVVTPSTLAVSSNWWNTATASEIDALIYDKAEDSLLTVATYSPFLTSEPGAVGSSLAYPPIADAGENQTGDPDEVISLDGSATSDPDNLFTWIWRQTSGTTVTLTSADTSTATFIVPPADEDDTANNTLAFDLMVTDGEGFSDTKSVEVTVNADAEEQDTHKTSGCFIGAVAHD